MSRPRLIAAAAVSASLLLAGCQNPDGSTNWGNTLLLGAGVGTAAALLAGAASDRPRGRSYAGYQPRGYQPVYGGYRGGYGGYNGYGGGYRPRW